MTDKPKLKIEFAPGAFDHFEGTQEELDELMRELTTMFAELTPEELAARSRPLTDADFDELPESVQQQLAASLTGDASPDRTLQ
jgi:hypothetical protein